MHEDEDLIYFNGVDGLTGTYAVDPMPVEKLAGYAYQALGGEDADTRFFKKVRGAPEDSFRPPSNLDDEDLSRVGWGVIFAEGADPQRNAAIREALAPLLALRQEQAGDLYREFLGPGVRGTAPLPPGGDPATGVRPNETKRQFLTRHKAPIVGITNPGKMPTYLLLVGDPQEIPFTFQYEIDIDYYVGRIHFPTVEAYHNYARSVVAAETGAVKLPRKAALFSVVNEKDRATRMSHDGLMTPLFDQLRADPDLRAPGAEWSFDLIGAEAATRERLGHLLGGDETPALLMTASHGMEYSYPDPAADPLRLPYTGALICRDWPGPRFRGPIPPEMFFSADQVDPTARLLGLIAFHFACYGAGSPHLSDHFRKDWVERGPVAPHAFLAALPQALLSHPLGGALAVIGHVERAYAQSFFWKTPSIDTMASTLLSLLNGHRVGKAMDDMNLRYAQIGAELANIIEQNLEIDPMDMVQNWTAHNDARGYVVLGDPAVRLAVGEDLPPAPP